MAMDLTAWFVVMPFIVASLVSGLVSSLGTTWGLLRHYWVLTKFALSIFATVILFMYLMYKQTLGTVAAVAIDATTPSDDLAALRTISPLLHAAGGLLVLLMATRWRYTSRQG